MKKLFTISFLLFLFFVSSAAAARQEGYINDNYDRSSLSVIRIERRGPMDRVIYSLVSGDLFGDKFDINVIPTRTLSAFSKTDASFSRSEDIDRMVSECDIAKEIISYWFNRKYDGSMDIERILERGMYNATDADYIRSEASRLGVQTLGDVGFSLIANSYVLVVDPVSFACTTLHGVSIYTSTVGARLYKLEYTDVTQTQLFECWINSDDTPEERALKNRMFEKMEFRLEPKQYVSATAYGVSADDAVEEAFYSMLRKLQNAEDALLVKTAVQDVKPIRAKIGTKEGAGNMKKYNVYGYYERENGEIYSKKKGVVRATEVVNNSSVTTGDSEMSRFYQIAGGTIEPGFILREKNDIGLGIGAGYRTGVYTGGILQAEKLLKISNHGGSQYVTLDLSYYIYKDRKNEDNTISSYSVGLGYAYGWHFARICEVKLGASVIWDNLKKNNDSSIKGDAFGIMPFVTLNVNIAYPLQIFGGVNTGFNITNSSFYNDMNKNSISGQRTDIFGIFGGLRYIF